MASVISSAEKDLPLVFICFDISSRQGQKRSMKVHSVLYTAQKNEQLT